MLDWYNLGTKLRLPDYKLGEVWRDCTGTVQRRQEMISKWLAYDTEASWNKLARALEEMGMHVVAKEVLDKYVPHYKSMFAWDQHVMILTFSGQGMLQSSKLLMHAYLKLIMASWTSNTCSTCHCSIMYTWIICYSTALFHIQSEHMTLSQISALPSFGVKLMLVAKHHSYSTNWQYLGRKMSTIWIAGGSWLATVSQLASKTSLLHT